MGVDESFAEYVAARWSMLYRLAVLLAGEDGADDLTQRALVRAYVGWSDVQEAASADDQVKRILATTAVQESQESKEGPVESADARPAAEASDPERLWASISALPRRQRAVLVLRHYEGLSDRDIAGAVKSSAKAVTAELRALEAGVDLGDLRTELARRADEALVPLPPIDSVRSEGHLAQRQHRRRTASRAGIAAALVLAALALTAAVEGGPSGPGPPGGPTPSADVPVFLSSLPHGATPAFPYSVRRFLYLPGGRGVDLAEQPAALALTPGWVYVAYLSGEIVRVDIDDPAVDPVVSSSGGQLVADPEGKQVAWLASAVGGAEVHRESADPTDPQGGAASQAFPAGLRCCDNPFEVNGITDDGELIASLPTESRAWVWDIHRDEGVREISGMGNGVVRQVLAHGLVVHYPPFQYSLGRIEDGNYLQVAEIVAVSADFGDPTARRIVYADTDGEIHVREVPTRGRSRRGETNIRLRLPTIDDGFSAARWEDDDHVILDVYDETAPDGALVRCDVRDGACELADKLEGPHLLAR